MAFPKGLAARLLAVIPAIFLVVLCNVFIAFATAGVVFLQLLESGVNKQVSLGVAILIAIGVHAYIAWNHKIRDYIKQGAKNE
jgi:succinate dehydrogenase hydrophobic anchor subunit